MKQPLQYAVYKGVMSKYGAIQFNLQRPHYYMGKQKDFTGQEALIDGKLQEGWKIREGCVFTEITSAKDKNVYDWDNKIILALSVNDIGKLLLGLTKTGETQLMHDPGAGTKTQSVVKKYLKVTVSDKGALFTCTQTSGGESKSHTVPLSPDEVVTLRVLLSRAVEISLNW